MPELPATTYSYGWIPDRPGLRPRMRFGPDVTTALAASNSRFSAGLPPIFDQGQLGSCTANGLVRAYMYSAYKAGMTQDMLSRLMLYYDERAMEGTVQSDAGAAIADGVTTLQSDGCCLEKTWPYDINKFTTKPPATAYAEAQKFELLKAAKVENTPDQIKAVLSTGWPVVIGFTVYQSMESAQTAKTGIVPIPSGFDQQIGGHCVLCNGYWDDSKQLIGFDNSWKADWGDHGSGYMPYWYFVNGLVSDCWVLYSVEGELPAPTPPIPPTPPPQPVSGMTAAQFQTNLRPSMRKAFTNDLKTENHLERWANSHFALLADNTIVAEPTS